MLTGREPQVVLTVIAKPTSLPGAGLGACPASGRFALAKNGLLQSSQCSLLLNVSTWGAESSRLHHTASTPILEVRNPIKKANLGLNAVDRAGCPFLYHLLWLWFIPCFGLRKY